MSLTLVKLLARPKVEIMIENSFLERLETLLEEIGLEGYDLKIVKRPTKKGEKSPETEEEGGEKPRAPRGRPKKVSPAKEELNEKQIKRIAQLLDGGNPPGYPVPREEVIKAVKLIEDSPQSKFVFDIWEKLPENEKRKRLRAIEERQAKMNL